jgi:hypothetical protein
MLDKTGFKQQVSCCETLPQPGSNRGCKTLTVLDSLAPVFGVVRTVSRMPGSPAMMLLFHGSSIGKSLPHRTLSSVFSPGSVRVLIIKPVIRFLAGFFQNVPLITLFQISILPF